VTRYDVVIADPPWFYTVNPGMPGVSTQTGAALQYDLMSDEDIFALPMRDRMEDKSVLFTWATCPKLDVAMKAIDAWGLQYRGISFIWIKTRADGVPWRAKGVRPSVVKPLTELVLVASPKKTGRPLPLSSESVVQTVFACPGVHSAKPEEVQDRIEQLYPTASKLEMFARRQRPKWVCEGDELDNQEAT
jgi:N6-adenosine-specific RNA methylase IME4